MPTTPAPDGSVLGWHEHGSGDPLVLLPGLSLGEVSWWPLQPWTFARTLAVDPRGVARSRPWQPPAALDDYADDVARVLDAAGVERADLAGVSFGAAVAQRVLVRHPDRVRRAVLLDAPVGHHPDRSALLERIADRASAGDLSGAWALLGPQLVGPSLAAAAPALWRGAGRLVPPLLLRSDGPALAAQVRALRALPDAAVEQLREVQVPVLLVQGGRDRLAPVADTLRLLDLLPDARLHLVPRAGHLAPLRVRRVRRAVREFLGSG